MFLDPAWLPSCSMRRVICHWTAGGHKASSLDKEHYHGEVQVQLGIPQDGKWDRLFLPWEPSMSASQVGTFFRTLVQASIDQGSVEPEAHVDVMEVATALGLKPRWNSGEHVLTLR